MDEDAREEVRLFEQFAKLPLERKRLVFRIVAEFDRLCGHLHDRITDHALGRNIPKGDDAERAFIQGVLLHLVYFCGALGMPEIVLMAVFRVLLAFEARREGGQDHLFDVTGAIGNRPHLMVLHFRAHIVAAVVDLRARGTRLDSALEQVHQAIAEKARDDNAYLPDDDTPTTDIIRGWYERRDGNTRFKRYYTGLGDCLPPDLSSRERTDWLLKDATLPRDGAALLLAFLTLG